MMVLSSVMTKPLIYNKKTEDIKVNLLIFLFHIPAGVCCRASSSDSAVLPHGFYFACGRRGQTQAVLLSGYGL